MQARNPFPGPRVSREVSERPWDVLCWLFTSVALAGLFSLAPGRACADRLRLAEREGGNEVEVIEEQPDAFIVKISKSEVALIKRETPTEVKLWKEKKILWEDQGDYLVISLPKERIEPPPVATTGDSPRYATAASLEAGLAETAEKGQGSALGIFTGEVRGRVLREERPLAGCLVRLSAIQGPASELTRLFGSKQANQPHSTGVEAATGSDGAYRFADVPIGDYDISWLPPGSTHWLGWLSDKPDVTVRAGEVTQQGDIEL